MTVAYEIVLAPIDQKFLLKLGGSTYHMMLRWCDALDGFWALDISAQDDAPIVHGIAVTGGVDLLSAYRYLNIGNGGFLYAITDGLPLVPPTRESLGSTAHLLWQPFE